MNKKIFTYIAVILVTFPISVFVNYWINTQPVWVFNNPIEPVLLKTLPPKNKKIIELLEDKGAAFAPGYKEAVCTEFIISIIEEFDPLTNHEKNDIRIITTKDVGHLIQNDAAVIRGIQAALTYQGKGTVIKEHEVLPGDFVQFWNIYQGKEYGHCGIVLDINLHKTISLYSSHPLTDGFGKQMYLWPDKLYFVRLK